MALPSELSRIKARLENKIRRTDGETRLLIELIELDRIDFRESIQKIQGSTTRMTGPVDGVCSCCGQQIR